MNGINPDGPLVSIVMPFLNAERFMEESIRSIFEQTYGVWELIFVDDGSSDSSTGIARRVCGRESRQAFLRGARGTPKPRDIRHAECRCPACTRQVRSEAPG